MLRNGNPGNKGGTGRPPKEVMSRSRALYERVLGELERTLDDAGQALTPEQLVAAGNMAGKYAGLGDGEDGTPVTIRVVRTDRVAEIAQADAAQRVTATATVADAVDAPSIYMEQPEDTEQPGDSGVHPWLVNNPFAR